MAELIVETESGKIRGFLKNTVPKSVEIYGFNNVPFGTYDRFEKPKSYGQWTKVYDGTTLTKCQPQVRTVRN